MTVCIGPIPRPATGKGQAGGLWRDALAAGRRRRAGPGRHGCKQAPARGQTTGRRRVACSRLHPPMRTPCQTHCDPCPVLSAPLRFASPPPRPLQLTPRLACLPPAAHVGGPNPSPSPWTPRPQPAHGGRRNSPTHVPRPEPHPTPPPPGFLTPSTFMFEAARKMLSGKAERMTARNASTGLPAAAEFCWRANRQAEQRWEGAGAPSRGSEGSETALGIYSAGLPAAA